MTETMYDKYDEPYEAYYEMLTKLSIEELAEMLTDKATLEWCMGKMVDRIYEDASEAEALNWANETL
jgi:hypothetical protein